MKKMFLAFCLVLGGCGTFGATVSKDAAIAWTDIQTVAQKIDAGAQLVAADLPGACKLSTNAANLVSIAVSDGLTSKLSANAQTDVLKAQSGLVAAGASTPCQAALAGSVPSDGVTAATDIAAAFVAIRAAVRGTPIVVTAVKAV